MSASDAARLRRSRTKLVLIFVLFLIPPVAAWVAWQYLGSRGVEATTNAGTLVSPARPLRVSGLRLADGSPLTDADLQGRWTYVVFAPDGCDERCERQLYLTRQVRLATNKDMQRVQRLLVLGAEPAPAVAQRLAADHTDLKWLVQGAQATPLLRDFRGDGFGPEGAQYFLVDPLGNLMMSYDLEVPSKGVLKDLQKLLKVSQIG
jgi:hypothetical protein